MAKLVIKIGGQGYDHKDLGNIVYLPDGVAEDVEDGGEAEVTVKGELIDHEGVRCLKVTEVDGEPVETPPDHEDKMGDMMDEEDSMDSEDDEDSEGEPMSLDDALAEKFNKTR